MDTLREAIRSFTIGPAVTRRNLTVFPLFGRPPGIRWYRTLEEALKSGSARVSEVSSAGSVPELMFVNDGKEPVLLVDGEELKGAKQNRVLNLTLLVAAGRSLVIPVSCVEAGRWAGDSLRFESGGQVLYSRARAIKVESVSRAMEEGHGYRSDQGRIWNDIRAKHCSLGTHSPSDAIEAAYRQRSVDLEDYVRGLGAVANQAGAAFAIDGRVMGAELFDHPETLSALIAKLVRSYALDAIETAGVADVVAPPPEAARAFLDDLADAPMEAFPALGMGQDVRITGARVVGAALVEASGLVHMSAFRLAEGASRGAADDDLPRMASYQLRRRWARGRTGSGGSQAA